MEETLATHDPYAALRVPDFRRLLGAAMLSTIGYEMQGVAIGWELLARTRSAFALGLVGLVQVVPVLLLALPAGHLADKFSRKYIMICAQVVLVCVSIFLTYAKLAALPVWTIYAALSFAGVALALALPARSAVLPQIVPIKLFANAVAWRTSGWQIAAVLGPALGGVCIAISGGTLVVFQLSVVLGTLVVVLVARIRPTQQVRTREALTWHSLLAGVRFVKSQELILAAITLDMFAVLFGGATFLLPIFAKDILRTGPTGLGWLRAAPSLGAVVMALLMAHRPPMRRAGQTLLLAVLGFGGATIAFGVSRQPWFSFAMLAIAGALDNISVVIRGTLVQTLTPDPMRGRVAAVNSVFVGMSNELGGFESGLLAHFLGPTGSVVFGGVGCLATVGLTAWRWPALWRMREISPPSPQDDECNKTSKEAHAGMG
jgi:MFS family permease